MPKKEVIQVNLAAANPNLSPRHPVWQSGLRGRADGETHPVSGEVGKKSARVKSLPLVCPR
jgi:hypothetical protein